MHRTGLIFTADLCRSLAEQANPKGDQSPARRLGLLSNREPVRPRGLGRRVHPEGLRPLGFRLPSKRSAGRLRERPDRRAGRTGRKRKPDVHLSEALCTTREPLSPTAPGPWFPGAGALKKCTLLNPPCLKVSSSMCRSVVDAVGLCLGQI